jgi:recombination protein RecR
MEFPSKSFEKAVNAMASLPGIGKKTAMRLVLHLLRQNELDVAQFGLAFLELKEKTKLCVHCHNISDAEVCNICKSPNRIANVICVVQDTRDVLAIENTAQFKGHYHVLGGLLSPLDGIGPNDLNIQTLLNKIKNDEISEVILALSATMEGDTTNFYLYRKLKDFKLKISTLARGVSVGGELEYTDEITLGRSLINRMPFESTLAK